MSLMVPCINYFTNSNGYVFCLLFCEDYENRKNYENLVLKMKIISTMFSILSTWLIRDNNLNEKRG